MALNQIGQIAIPVTDIDQSIEFYRDKLGLKLLFQAPPGLGFFACGEIRLMLDQTASNNAGNGSVIYFKVEDIHSSFHTLLEKAVSFEREPHLVAKMPDHELWMAFLRDPDGNILALMGELRNLD